MMEIGLMPEQTLMAMIAERLSRIENTIDNERKESQESRRRMHEKQEAMSYEMLALKARFDTLQTELIGIRPTVSEVLARKQQAQGAGALGRFLWKVAGISIAMASGAAGAYAWMMGLFTRG
jgi:hypothetical protein